MKKKFRKIISNIRRNLFLKYYGRVKLPSKKQIKKLNIKKKLIKFNKIDKYKIIQIPNCRIYFNKINDVSFIKNNFIIGEASHQIRKFKGKILRDDSFGNSYIKDNFILNDGTPKIAKKLNGNVCSLLYTNASKDNYYHWFTDVIPKLAILEKANLLSKIDYFLVHSFQKEFQISSLNKLNIKKKQLINANKINHIKANNLIYIDHPFIKKKFLLDSKKLPTWIGDWYRKKFIKMRKGNKTNILILRKNSENRKILNQRELKEFLKQKSFKPVYLENLTFDKQINLFQEANIVIGLNGSGLTNLFFCNRKTTVIEMMFKKSNAAIYGIARSAKIKYRKVYLNQTKIDQRRNQDGEGNIDLSIINKIIKKINQKNQK